MSTERCDRFDKEGLLRREEGLTPDDHEASCRECARARLAYERIAAQLTELPRLAPPAGWEERVLGSVANEAAPVFRLPWAWLVPLAAAAALVLYLVARSQPKEQPLAVRQEVVATQVGRRADSATVGDTVRIRATGAGVHRELRVYRGNDELVARCPGDPRCGQDDDATVLDLPLEVPGVYRSLVLAGPRELPPPTGSLDGDARVAAESGARVELSGPVEVE